VVAFKTGGEITNERGIVDHGSHAASPQDRRQTFRYDTA
jgi:hypothetical protein